jgi:hypothetical protein
MPTVGVSSSGITGGGGPTAVRTGAKPTGGASLRDSQDSLGLLHSAGTHAGGHPVQTGFASKPVAPGNSNSSNSSGGSGFMGSSSLGSNGGGSTVASGYGAPGVKPKATGRFGRLAAFGMGMFGGGKS